MEVSNPQVFNSPELEKLITSAVKAKTLFTQTIENNKTTLEFFNDNEKCPSCSQGIPHEHKSNIIETLSSDQNKLTNNIDIINDAYNKLIERQLAQNDINKKITSLNIESNAINMSISNLTKQNKKLNYYLREKKRH